MSDGERRDAKFWIGFFIGGLLGAITLVFLETKEGKKTGKLLEERGQDILDHLQEKLNTLEERGREFVRQSESMKDEVVKEFVDKKESMTQEATEKLDTALAHIEALQEHGRETTASLRKRLFRNLPKKAS